LQKFFFKPYPERLYRALALMLTLSTLKRRKEEEFMSCPPGYLSGCDMVQALVDETPRFDERIMMDIRPTDGWLLNVSTGTTPMGTPIEITQDRFRAVFPNTTKTWTRKVANGPGCSGNPCDPTEHQIGWGADRLTYYAETQSWGTPIICYDQDMHITHAEQHIDQIISDVLRPATSAIHSNYLRKRHLLWSNRKNVATSPDMQFNYQWTLAGPNLDEEQYFDASVSPAMMYKLVPQMLQRRFTPLMMRGYAGKNPFKETSPFIELVLDMDTTWELGRLGGQTGVGPADSPNVLSNWRFESFSAADKYWRYGFGMQLGNFMVRVDDMGLRFNYVTDLGPGANGGNGNRYRYQIVLPFVNSITTGAGGSAGIGDDYNTAFANAQYRIGQIHHKMGMELLVPDAKPLNPEMPFGHRDFGGKWQFVMHDLGADVNGVAIQNKRKNKGQFIADFLNYIRPLHYEFMEVFFFKAEQMPIPLIEPVTADPGYPQQFYGSELPVCPLPSQFNALYGVFPCAVPTGSQDGPVPSPTPLTPNLTPDT
jgi:hypothetical protein